MAFFVPRILMRLKSAGPPWDRAWDSILSGSEYSSEVLAECFAVLHARKEYDQVVEGIEASLRHGLAQPWMYDLLPLEMQLAGRPKPQIERALLSRVDFAESDPAQLLVTAAMMSRFGADDAAVRICREAVRRNPWQPEGWIVACRYADRAGDPTDIVWARTGILRYVWTDDSPRLHAEAVETLESLEGRLRAAGRSADADKVASARGEAVRRDLRVVVEWAGDADLDLAVTEPGGAVCSRSAPVTANGGVLAVFDDGGDGGRHREEYVLSRGPDGEYTAVIRLVRGRIVGGRAIVRVIQHDGASNRSESRVTVAPAAEPADVRVELRNR